MAISHVPSPLAGRVYSPPMRRQVLPLPLCVASVTAVVGAPKTLDVWVVDTEGGKAVLVISPEQPGSALALRGR